MVEEGEGEIAGDTEVVPHTGAREPIEQVVADGVHAFRRRSCLKCHAAPIRDPGEESSVAR